MASQKVFIDLVDNEVEHQYYGSHQDKVTPFEASMESMKRKIDRIRGLVIDLRNSSDVASGFSESMSESHFVASVYTMHDGIPNPLRKDFDPNKHCAFDSGMQDHDTNECRHLKEEIQKLIISGRISQRTHPQLVWYQPPEIIPTSNYTPIYHSPFTMRPLFQTMWNPPPTIAPTSNYIPIPYPRFIGAAYPYNQATIPRAQKNMRNFSIDGVGNKAFEEET
ncbi:hypothetical protein HAX54_034695 [Datura stramonium]|uniref:Uncharacterized protein n=1 Tax=Datura stramonium TaxID=4076 RepID=A0ABS8VEE6_DATST|nr:hypothetical protein [Datura stramonium]